MRVRTSFRRPAVLLWGAPATVAVAWVAYPALTDEYKHRVRCGAKATGRVACVRSGGRRRGNPVGTATTICDLPAAARSLAGRAVAVREPGAGAGGR